MARWNREGSIRVCAWPSRHSPGCAARLGCARSRFASPTSSAAWIPRPCHRGGRTAAHAGAVHLPGGVMIHYQDRWAVVTGASSGLGRGLATRLADRGMSLVLTGRNEARLDEVARQIRRAAPGVKVELVAADLSTRSGMSALLDHVSDR